MSVRSYDRVLAWFRSDDRRRIVSAFAHGAASVTAGALMLAVAWLLRARVGSVATPLAIIGALATVAGPLYAVLALKRVMADEAALIACHDGIRVQHADRELFVAWEDVVEVRDDAERVVVERQDADPLVIDRRFADIDAPRLARRLTHLRARVLLGIG